ncbi:MAG: hypothetical protein ACREEM_13920 [Blastocatellia bacterium]
MNGTANINSMLWRKFWWETRWMFPACIGALAVLCLMFVWRDYDAARWADRLLRDKDLGESARMALNGYRGHTWSIWFKTLLTLVWAIYAVILGAACHAFTCPYMPSHGAIAHFTLSLPITRRKMLLSQVALMYCALALIALVPSLIVPPIASLQGQWFSWKDAIIFSLLTTFGGAAFFGFAYLLSVLLGNWIKAFAIAEVAVFAFLWGLQPTERRSWWHPYSIMAGESYFYDGRIPWLGLLISVTLAVVFVCAAIRIFEHRDL